MIAIKIACGLLIVIVALACDLDASCEQHLRAVALEW